MKFPIESSCQCGQVKFTLLEKPKMVVACHCTECQKLATSPFSITAIYDSSAIEFTGDLNEWSRSSDSGNTSSAKFCPSCGNRIYHYNPAEPNSIKLKLKPTNLEDDTLFEPSAHIWVSEKLSWYTIPEGVKVIDKQP